MKTIEDAVRAMAGAWPGSAPSSEVLVFSGSVGWQAWKKEWAGKEFHDWYEVCTRNKFEACARRLRNEPSWDDAPDWAVAKAQDGESGNWYWYEVVPRPITTKAVFRSSGGEAIYASKGEVIGSWYNTLRLRPEEKKMEDKKQMNASEAVYGFAAWLTCRKNKVCFSSTDDAGIAADLVREFCSANALPGISDNWPNNLVHPEDKNDWHQRGELPPVGTVCGLRYVTTATSIVVTITYVGDGVLCYRGEKGEEYSAASDHVELRPIQTERERVVKAWIEELGDHDILNAYLGGLYDIGALKMPEDKQ